MRSYNQGRRILSTSIFKELSETVKWIKFDPIIVNDPVVSIEKAEPLLEQNGLAPQIRTKQGYITNGISWYFTNNTNKEYSIHIVAVPDLSSLTFKFIRQFLAACTREPINTIGVTLQLTEAFNIPTNPLKVWSLIYQSDITAEDNKYFRYDGIVFAVNNRLSLHVKIPIEQIDSDVIYGLFNYLLSLGIISKGLGDFLGGVSG